MLITLTIVGVIAALTIPNLIAKYQKEELKTALKQVYNEFAQINLKYIADNGISLYEQGRADNVTYGAYTMYKDTPYISPYSFPTYMSKYMQIIDKTITVSSVTEKRLEVANKSYTLNKKYNINLGGTYIKDIKGREWFINGLPEVTIDLNGLNKGPNIWGYDIFTVTFDKEGKVDFVRKDMTNAYCDYKSAYDANGLACTYYALYDKHPKYPNDPTKTYWKDFIK